MLEELLEALSEKGFALDEEGCLYDRNRYFTGFVVDTDNQELAGCDDSVKTYGFDSFVAALQELSPLLAEANLTREGEDHNDTEGYEFDSSRWYVAVYPVIMVPVGRETQASERLERVADDLRNL